MVFVILVLVVLIRTNWSIEFSKMLGSKIARKTNAPMPRFNGDRLNEI